MYTYIHDEQIRRSFKQRRARTRRVMAPPYHSSLDRRGSATSIVGTWKLVFRLGFVESGKGGRKYKEKEATRNPRGTITRCHTPGRGETSRGWRAAKRGRSEVQLAVCMADYIALTGRACLLSTHLLLFSIERSIDTHLMHATFYIKKRNREREREGIWIDIIVYKLYVVLFNKLTYMQIRNVSIF